MSEPPRGAYRKWSEIRPAHTSTGEPRPDPYEEQLAAGFGEDSVSAEGIVGGGVGDDDPFGSDEEHATFLADLRRSRREEQ